MVYKTIGSKSIIAKVISDLNITDDQIRITDIREWIGEAIEKIGAYSQYDNKVEVLPVIDYAVKLPCDLYQLDQVAFSFNGRNWLPTRVSSHSFGVPNKRGSIGDMFIKNEQLVDLVKDMFSLDTAKEALDMVNDNKALADIIKTAINASTYGGQTMRRYLHDYQHGIQYIVKQSCLNLNVRNGYVKLAYKAIPTDDEGMPMIPDLESYKEAIYWYIVQKLTFPDFLEGRIPSDRFFYIKQSWNFHRLQAYNEAMMPNLDGMETIKNNWLKLYPEIDEHNTFYSHTGDEQRLYNY